MRVILNYKVKAGKYDNNDDVFEWIVDSPNKELEEAYTRAIMTGTYLEDVPEFKALCEQERSKIEKHVLQEMSKDGDEYSVLEALGEVKMDLDELNNLVHSKDSHALKFFGLEGMSADQLQKLYNEKMDHQDFITSWIHEVKVPIAAGRLLMENSNGRTVEYLVDKFEDELDRIENYVEQAL